MGLFRWRRKVRVSLVNGMDKAKGTLLETFINGDIETSIWLNPGRAKKATMNIRIAFNRLEQDSSKQVVRVKAFRASDLDDLIKGAKRAKAYVLKGIKLNFE